MTFLLREQKLLSATTKQMRRETAEIKIVVNEQSIFMRNIESKPNQLQNEYLSLNSDINFTKMCSALFPYISGEEASFFSVGVDDMLLQFLLTIEESQIKQTF